MGEIERKKWREEDGGRKGNSNKAKESVETKELNERNEGNVWPQRLWWVLSGNRTPDQRKGKPRAATVPAGRDGRRKGDKEREEGRKGVNKREKLKEEGERKDKKGNKWERRRK